MSFVTVRQRYSSSQVEVESQQQQQLLSLQAENTLDYINLYRALSCSSSHCDASWRRNLESCLWIASAAFIVYYGDFRTNLVVLLATDSRIHRFSFNLGLACFIVDIVILLYLAYKLHNVNKSEDKLVFVAPGTIPAATIIGVIAFILFSYALWPIWRFLTLPMLVSFLNSEHNFSLVCQSLCFCSLALKGTKQEAGLSQALYYYYQILHELHGFEFTLFMALVVAAPYIAPYMHVRLDVDALRGLYVRPNE